MQKTQCLKTLGFFIIFALLTVRYKTIRLLKSP
jgi:hypothetical protein